MPNMELKNWAKIRAPDWISFSDQRSARTGSMGPRKVITIPVIKKSMWTRAVPRVTHGNFLVDDEKEVMVYDGV